MEMQQSQVTQISEVGNAKQLPSVAEIQAWLISYIAKMLETDPNEISVTISFNRYGLDSSMTLGLISDLEVWVGLELDPTLMYNYPTIESLAQHVGLTLG